MAAAAQWAPVKYSQTMFGAQAVQGGLVPGGLDLTTPSLKLSPGALRDMLNFEVSINGGYTRIKGYERFDGRQSPSSTTYTIVQLANIAMFPAVGTLVFQFGTVAQGIVASISALPVPYLVLTDVVGVFDDVSGITTIEPEYITVSGMHVTSGGFYARVFGLEIPAPIIIDPTKNTTVFLAASSGITIGATNVVLTVSTA